MSITATNNPYPDSPDPSPSKLDRGGYEGTAETLDNKIDEVLVEALLKIDGVLSDSTIINNVTTSSSIPPTGNIHALGVGPGTYPNWGGMVIPANNIGTLQRVSGVYSVSLTPIVIPDSQIVAWTAKSYLSGDQVNHLGIDWVSNAATVAGDVPGTSSKWIERLTAYEKTTDVILKLLPKANLQVGKNLFNWQDPDVVLNSSFGGGGTTIGVTANVVISGYIPVTAGQTLICSKGSGGYADNYYNANKVYLSSSTTSGGLTTVPVDAFYLRKVIALTSGGTVTIQQVQIELGSTATPFEAYKFAVPNSELANATLLSEFKIEQFNKNLKLDKTFSKNLFNKNGNNTIGYSLDSNGVEKSNVLYNISHYIPVQPSTTYTFSNNALGSAKCAYYNIDKQFISSFSTPTFTTPTDIYYVRISYGVSISALTQVELGTGATSYASYTENKALDDAIALSESKVDVKINTNNARFLNTNANLVDESKVLVDIYQNSVGATSSSTYSLSTSDFIPLISGQTMVISRFNYSGIDYICFFDTNKAFISSVAASTLINNVVTGVANCAYVRLPFNTWLIGASELQAEYGTTRTPYKPYGFTLKKEYVEYTNGENLVDVTKFYNGFLNNLGNLTKSNTPNTERVSTMIKVKAGDKIFTNNIFNFNVCEYDINQNFLRYYYGVVGISTPYVIGANTAYFRFKTSKTHWESNLMFRISDTAIPADYYVPYQNSVDYVKASPITQDIVMPKKIWGLSNERLVLFTDAIKKRYANDNDYTLILKHSTYDLLVNQINNRKAYTYANLTTTKNLDTILYDNDFSPKKIVTTSLVTADLATNNGAVVLNPIGDSLTDITTQYKWIKDNCPNVSFVGARYNDTVLMEHNGNSGWTLKQFLTRIHSPNEWAGYSEFVHPTDLTLNYYGCTKLWIAEYNLQTIWSKMKHKGDAIGGFSATTGLRNTPNTNDVQYVFSEAVYKKWNGSAWVTIADPTFTFNYAKFLSVWNIIQPTHVPIQIGTNDYSRVTELGAIARFNADFVTDMNTVITSIHAVNANIKVGVIIPPLRATADCEDTSWNTPINACMWQERKTIIDTYGDREDEKIYVIDNGTAVDTVNGFGENGVITDSTHPNATGFTQMGKRIGAWLQANR